MNLAVRSDEKGFWVTYGGKENGPFSSLQALEEYMRTTYGIQP